MLHWTCDECFKPADEEAYFQNSEDGSGDVLILHPDCMDVFFAHEQAVS